MPISEVLFDFGVPIRFADGFRSPYTRHLIVDPGENGDFTTLTAALAYAVTQNPNSGNRWLIEAMPANYVEAITIPSFVTLAMPIGGLASITGGTGSTPSVTLNGRAKLVGGNILTSGTVAVRMNCDISGSSPSIFGTEIYAETDADDAVTCVEIDGPVFSGAYANVTHCPVIYARNPNTGSNAKAVLFRLMPGGAALRAHANHYKLSSGPGGASGRRLAWNQGDHEYAQMDLTGTIAVYNGADYYEMYNENALCEHGGRIMVPGTGWVDEYTTDNYTIPRALIHDTRPSAGTSNRFRYYAQSINTNEAWIGGSPLLPAVAYRTDEWYNAPGMGLPATTVLTQNVERAAPFPINSGHQTWKAIRVEVTTAAAGSTVRLGLRAMAADGRPGTKVYEWGTIDSSSTGFKTISFTAVRIPPGMYFLVAVAEGGSPTVRHVAGTGAYVPQGTTQSGYNAGYEGSHTPGSIATNFTYTGLSLTTPRLALQSGG